MNYDRFSTRVWCVDTAEMIYDIMRDNKGFWFIDDHGIDYDCQHFYGDNHIQMQCTGLKDKNGKLIYEGDIITYEYEYGKQFPKGGGYIKWLNDGLVIQGTDKYFCQISKSLTYEIIGNIHMNPELLEVKE